MLQVLAHVESEAEDHVSVLLDQLGPGPTYGDQNPLNSLQLSIAGSLFLPPPRQRGFPGALTTFLGGERSRPR